MSGECVCVSLYLERISLFCDDVCPQGTYDAIKSFSVNIKLLVDLVPNGNLKYGDINCRRSVCVFLFVCCATVVFVYFYFFCFFLTE